MSRFPSLDTVSMIQVEQGEGCDKLVDRLRVEVSVTRLKADLVRISGCGGCTSVNYNFE